MSERIRGCYDDALLQIGVYFSLNNVQMNYHTK